MSDRDTHPHSCITVLSSSDRSERTRCAPSSPPRPRPYLCVGVKTEREDNEEGRRGRRGGRGEKRGKEGSFMVG